MFPSILTAVRTMKESVRTSALKSLRELRPVGAEYLCRIPPALWTNSAFPVETWDEDTSNLGEQQVNWVGIRDARSEPGVKFVSNLIRRLADLHVKHRKHLLNHLRSGELITSYAKGIFEVEIEQSCNYVVKELLITGPFSFRVHRISAAATSSGIVEEYHEVGFCPKTLQ